MFDAGPCFGMFTVLPRARRVEYPGAIYHVMDCGDRREDILLNGTATGAKSLLHIRMTKANNRRQKTGIHCQYRRSKDFEIYESS